MIFSGLSLEVVAMVHLAGAFAILSFVVVHIYMITTGHTILARTRCHDYRLGGS